MYYGGGTCKTHDITLLLLFQYVLIALSPATTATTTTGRGTDVSVHLCNIIISRLRVLHAHEGRCPGVHYAGAVDHRRHHERVYFSVATFRKTTVFHDPARLDKTIRVLLTAVGVR